MGERYTNISYFTQLEMLTGDPTHKDHPCRNSDCTMFPTSSNHCSIISVLVRLFFLLYKQKMVLFECSSAVAGVLPGDKHFCLRFLKANALVLRYRQMLRPHHGKQLACRQRGKHA